VRVAVADDSPHFRAGIEALLASVGAQVLASVENGPALLSAIRQDPPDVAIADMRMPPTKTNEGLLVAHQIKATHRNVGVLVISADDQAPYATEFLAEALPGTGYALKANITERAALRRTLDRLAAGDLVVDSDVARRLAVHPATAARLTSLTEVEQAVLIHAAQRKTAAQIAEVLETSTRAASDLLDGLATKLGIGSSPGVPDLSRQLLIWLVRGSGV